MNLGRDRPNNFYGLGQDQPRRAGLAQHGQPSGGRIIFLPPARLLHATCRRRNCNQNKGNAGGRACTWRGGGVAGGAAVAWLLDGGSGRCCGGLNGGERDSFLVVFSSVFFSVFGFDFLALGLFLFSPLSRALSLSSSLSPALFPIRSPSLFLTGPLYL